jgi:hypothetical protein
MYLKTLNPGQEKGSPSGTGRIDFAVVVPSILPKRAISAFGLFLFK